MCRVLWMEQARHYHTPINGSVVLSAHAPQMLGGWLMAPVNGQILGPGKNERASPFFFLGGRRMPKLAMAGGLHS